MDQSSFTTISDTPTRLLVITDEQWWVHAIGSILEPSGYTVTSVPTLARGLETMQDFMPGAVLVHLGLPNETGPDIIRTLGDFGLDPTSPVFLLSTNPLSRDERIAALRAGAWDCIHPPLVAEELVLKLGTYLSAKRTVDRIRQHALIDEETGLYSMYGIVRRVQELARFAQRHHRALGCAAFTFRMNRIDQFANPPAEADSGYQALVDRLGHFLVARGRTSDVVGRIGRSEFVILAPETDPEGVVRMAHRLADECMSSDALHEAVKRDESYLCAGCYAVPDFASAELSPFDLVIRATDALRRVQSDPDVSAPIRFYASAAN